jgi:flagellar protein FlgJ
MENSAVNTFVDMTRVNGSANADKATLMRMKRYGDDEALKMASKEFAAVFIGQMFSEMSKTVGKSELMNGGVGEEVFRGMLDQEYARQTAYSDRMKLGELVYQSLKKRQGDAAPQVAPAPITIETQPVAADAAPLATEGNL